MPRVNTTEIIKRAIRKEMKQFLPKIKEIALINVKIAGKETPVGDIKIHPDAFRELLEKNFEYFFEEFEREIMEKMLWTPDL